MNDEKKLKMPERLRLQVALVTAELLKKENDYPIESLLMSAFIWGTVFQHDEETKAYIISLKQEAAENES